MSNNLGFLEIIYGILFDPVKTSRRLAENPPLLLTLIIVTLVNAAGALMNLLTVRTIGPGWMDPALAQMMASMAPFLIISGFFLWYAKWLGYGAILHLTAQLLDGKGGPRGTLVAYGLAGLPALLMLPVEGLVAITNAGESLASLILGLFGLVAFVWSVVLLVIGLREVHQFSTGRAVVAVLAPVGVIILLAIVLSIVISFGFMTMLPVLPGFPAGF